MLWWPPSESKSEGDAGVSPVVEQSRTETAAVERVSLAGMAPVEGVFLRQWGSLGIGEGKFCVPEGMCVSGEEVFVCDKRNHRIQVFTRDGSFVRQWGSKGSGQGQFSYPVAVAVSKWEVFVCDVGNHRIQVFGVDGSFVR
jgi:DNA-binding beta-propeller fold protein YncE